MWWYFPWPDISPATIFRRAFPCALFGLAGFSLLMLRFASCGGETCASTNWYFLLYRNLIGTNTYVFLVEHKIDWSYLILLFSCSLTTLGMKESRNKLSGLFSSMISSWSPNLKCASHLHRNVKVMCIQSAFCTGTDANICPIHLVHP